MGEPQFYKAANAHDAGFAAPENRHGQSVRTWVRSLTDMQKEALVYSGMTGAAWRLTSDEGSYLRGADIAPNPLSFLSVGMIASYMNEIAALAKLRGVALKDIELTLENFYYREGAFAKGNMISGALPPELTVTCDTDVGDDTMLQLVFEAVSASPLNGLLLGAHTSLFTLTHNGRVLTPSGVSQLDHAPYPDPGDHFPRLEQTVDSHIASPLMVKTLEENKVKQWVEENPQKAPTLDPGRHLLHLRTTCKLRPDGVKDIVKQQFAQPTSSWRFLSDEAAGFGGEGRAPDAATYISAGIAFCFMTQFGRFAHLAKLPLEAYRIIQDTHFSLGGASGGTGKMGLADPIETHVYMDTDMADEAAQNVLRVGERTCFLHALARTDLKARTRYLPRRLAAAG
jgi:uncharacterized OsmC-like protein